MARTTDGRTTLVEVKAVDDAYPLLGTVVTDPAMPLPRLFARQGDAFGAAADPALLTRLDLKPGDRITIGNAVIELRAALTGEPDKLAGGIGLGPRLLISEAALRASGLLQPGSLVRWHYRLRLPATGSSDAAVASIEKQAQAQFPNAGWEIRTRNKASPQLERNVERFSQFLTLVALTALLVGGVGVANAVASHLARKRDAIATHEGARRDRRRRFRHLLRADHVGRAVCHTASAPASARRCRSRWRRYSARMIPLPVAPSLHPAGADAVDRLWIVDGAGLRAVAARTRARHFGIDAVPRPGRRGADLAAAAATWSRRR